MPAEWQAEYRTKFRLCPYTATAIFPLLANYRRPAGDDPSTSDWQTTGDYAYDIPHRKTGFANRFYHHNGKTCGQKNGEPGLATRHHLSSVATPQAGAES